MRRASTSAASANVSPATKRCAPSRMPCLLATLADALAARRRQDALAQRAVDALGDGVGGRAARPCAHAGTDSSRPSTARSSSRSLVAVERADRRAHVVARCRRRGARSTVLSADGIGKRSSVMRAGRGALGGLGRPAAHGLDDELGERRGERRDRADRAAREALRDQRLGPHEDVEAVDQVRLEALPRRLRDLQARRGSRRARASARSRRAEPDSRCGR